MASLYKMEYVYRVTCKVCKWKKIESDLSATSSAIIKHMDDKHPGWIDAKNATVYRRGQSAKSAAQSSETRVNTSPPDVTPKAE
jgi:hypothetical protein